MSQAIQDLLQALVGKDDLSAEAAAAGLSGLDPALQPQALLSTPQPDQRWWAARALAALPGVEITPLLLQVLEDEDAPVRQCALLGLRQRPDPGAVAGLVAALDDPDPLARRLAGQALEAMGGEAVLALLEVMEGGSHPARLEAVRALATIGDTRAIPALFDSLEGSALLEYWANEGLERMGVGMNFFIPNNG